MIEIGHIPENGLISACCGRLVQAVHHLLKGIRDDLVNGALPAGQISQYICAAIIIITVFSANEIVEIGLPFRGTDGAAKLTGQCKDEIHEGAVEGRQILWRSTGAANAHVSMQEERVQGNRYAVGLAHKAGFIMAVDFMLFQLPEIFLSQINAVHLAQLVIHGKAVEGNGILLEDLGFQRGDTGLFDIGIGINGAASGRIVCSGIAFDKILKPLVGFILGDSHEALSSLSATQARRDNPWSCRPVPAWERS